MTTTTPAPYINVNRNGRENNYMLLSSALVKRETDKAILISVQAEFAHDVYNREIWLPKTQVERVEGSIYASVWILAQKAVGLCHGDENKAANVFFI